MFFFFKQKTAYEMRISDWSSDVCSSDLVTATVDVPDLTTDPGGIGRQQLHDRGSQVLRPAETFHRGEIEPLQFEIGRHLLASSRAQRDSRSNAITRDPFPPPPSCDLTHQPVPPPRPFGLPEPAVRTHARLT